MSVDEDLRIAKERCNGVYRPVHYFWHAYSFNTENIKGYIKHFDIKDKSVLTLGSSGEQVINAHICGAKAITLYDINNFAGYYTWLKVAAIASLNYKEYQRFLFKYTSSKSENIYRFHKTIFDKVAPVLKELNYDSYYFWNELITSKMSRGAVESILKDEETRARIIKGYSLYLDNEEDFNKAKKVIRDITFEHINRNILSDDVEGTYDNIFLSNISSYLKVEELLELIKRLDKNLNVDGRMLFAYLYNCDFSFDGELEDLPQIYQEKFVKNFFKNYFTEYYSFPSSRTILWNDEDKNDVALVYHKK